METLLYWKVQLGQLEALQNDASEKAQLLLGIGTKIIVGAIEALFCYS